MVKRIVITGANGLLGHNLLRYFESKQWEVVATDVSSVAMSPESLIRGDLLDSEFCRKLIDDASPCVVLNTVGLPSLERCEEEPNLARSINATSAENLAVACKRAQCRMLHISTDHLFAGNRAFYAEDSVPEPLNVYAATKLEGEQKVLSTNPDSIVVRTNFYGWSPAGHAPTFGEWLFNSLKTGTRIKLFSDYYFCPIEVSFLAVALEILISDTIAGILNVVGSQCCSKAEFGLAMALQFGFGIDNVEVCSKSTVVHSLIRPKNLSLSVDKCNHLFPRIHLPDLKEGLKAFQDSMPS